MSKKLEGKVALVTGASRGIGRATALRLAKDGAAVLVHYAKNNKNADEVVAAIRADGGTAYAVGADLSDSTGVSKLATEVTAALGKYGLGEHLHILVNNAAVAEPGGLSDSTEQQFDQMFNVNVRSVFFLTQKLIGLVPSGGRIVNLSSVVSRAAFPTVATYSMTKGALDVLTRNLAAELGSRGITVNSVAPGSINTDMNPYMKSEEGRAQVLAMQSIPELGQPEHIADAVAFLAGPDGRWVTGQILDASGGTKL